MKDDFSNHVPAWRRAKLRKSLRAAEHEGRSGDVCGYDHRALQRRWLIGKSAETPTEVRKPSPDEARDRMTWEAIVAWRGSVSPVAGEHLPQGAAKLASNEAAAACRAAGLRSLSYGTIHSWFNYREAPVRYREVLAGVVLVAPQKIDSETLREILPCLPLLQGRLLERVLHELRSYRHKGVDLPAPAVAAWMRAASTSAAPLMHCRAAIASEWLKWTERGRLTPGGAMVLEAYEVLASIAQGGDLTVPANLASRVRENFSSAVPEGWAAPVAGLDKPDGVDGLYVMRAGALLPVSPVMMADAVCLALNGRLLEGAVMEGCSRTATKITRALLDGGDREDGGESTRRQQDPRTEFGTAPPGLPAAP